MQEGERVKATPTENEPPSRVPAGAEPDGEVRGRWPWAERAVWTERMLAALERGPKHGRWHCLIDKVYAPRTLWAAWEKVAANDGAAGVDQVSIARFAQTAVPELEILPAPVARGSLRATAGAQSMDTQTRQCGKATAGHPGGARPHRADGAADGAGADLRARLRARKLWLPARSWLPASAGPGGATARRRLHPRGGRRPEKLLGTMFILHPG